MKPTIGIKGKVIHSQAREIIANVLHFMRQEAENQGPIVPLANFKERLLAATKISKTAYRSIVKESKKVQSGESTSFSTPRKNRSRISPKSSIWEGDKEAIRTIIHNFFIIEKRKPTLKGIYNKVADSGLEFQGGLSTLRKIIHNMGFK